MKPLAAPNVPGRTDAQRMSNALRMVLTVSKAELLKKEARVKLASVVATRPVSSIATLPFQVTTAGLLITPPKLTAIPESVGSFAP